MEKNYKVYNLDGEFLEYSETRSSTSYGKPGLDASHAKEHGLTCYATLAPGSPADFRACKKTYARFFGQESSDAVWCIFFTVWDVNHNLVLVKDENKVRAKIEFLLERFKGELKETDINVSLRKVE